MSQPITVVPRDSSNPSSLPPLTRNGYARSEETDSDILALIGLSDSDLLVAFAPVDEACPDYRSFEALAFFVRRAHRSGDVAIRDQLFAMLTARCQLYFRGAIRGLDPQARMDVQQDVLTDLARLLLAPDDRGDFLECRFLVYLKRETARARGKVRQRLHRTPLIGDIVGDEDGEDLFVANHRHEQQLAAADRARVREVIGALPEALRELVVLRYFAGWQIGDERNRAEDRDRVTLAKRYGVTPRTIQNRLGRAYALMLETWKDDQ